MPQCQCLLTQQRNGHQGIERRDRRSGVRPTLHLQQIVFQHVIGQGRIRLALRLAQFEIQSQQHVLYPAHALCQLLVIVQMLQRFLYQTLQLLPLFGMRLRQIGLFQHGGDVQDVIEPGVDLRLEEQRGMPDHLGFACCQHIQQLGLDFARPRPAAEVGDAGIIDGDDGDPVAGLARRSHHAPVIRLAFQTLDQIGMGREQEYKHHRERGEPVSFPECVFSHVCPERSSIILVLPGRY